MQKLLLHPATRQQLELFLINRSHALMLVGPIGSGKRKLAYKVSQALLDLSSDSALEAHPHFIYIYPEKGKEISIDQIRAVIKKLMLKVPGKPGTKRVVFIEDAQLMSLEAQNALLKLLEEPGRDTNFVLSVPSEKAVLATIASRAARLNVYPVSIAQAREFFKYSHESKVIESSWLLSRGASGLLCALLENENHPLKISIGEARKWLKLNPYRRAVEIESIYKERSDLVLFLEALKKLLGALHHKAIETRSHKTAGRLLEDRRLVQTLQLAVESNVSGRLIGLKLLINIKV